MTTARTMLRHTVQVDTLGANNLSDNLSLVPGILLGLRRSASTTAVLLAIPTPPAPPGASALSWAALHARAITHLAPGGLAVVGVYAHTDAGSLTLVDRAAEVGSHGNGDDSTIVALTCDTRGRLGAKALVPGFRGASASLIPAELCTVDGLGSSICAISASLPLESVSCGAPGSGGYLTAAETLCITGAADCIEQSLLLHLPPNLYISSPTDSRPIPMSEGVLAVSVLLPAVPTRATSPVRLRGTLSICAVVATDATLGEVLAAVRADASASLKMRVEMLHEMDTEVDEDSTQDAGDRPLPARVLATPTNAVEGFRLCDYITAEETIEDDVIKRVGELMAWESDEVATRFEFKQVERIYVHGDNRELHEVRAPFASDAFPLADHSFGLAVCGLATATIAAIVGIALQLSYVLT
jgi:hypothetical protein